MKIDGRKIAEGILEELKTRVKNLKAKNTIPHLTVILTSKDPSSVSYVNQKKLKGEEIAVKISVKHVPHSISQSKLLATIEQLSNDNNVHGVIIQRPLPKNIDTNAVSLAISPNKDVDGFLPNSKFEPPIFMAVITLLNQININPKEKHVVIFGKGETGGKPIIDGFEKMGIEASVIDSKTKNPLSITKNADIIISAVGKPNVIKPEMIRKGVVLIGVGLFKGEDGKMHGDYNEEKIKNLASFYTPTPGGVGPVNVAMLLNNLVSAAENLSSLV